MHVPHLAYPLKHIIWLVMEFKTWRASFSMVAEDMAELCYLHCSSYIYRYLRIIYTNQRHVLIISMSIRTNSDSLLVWFIFWSIICPSKNKRKWSVVYIYIYLKHQSFWVKRVNSISKKTILSLAGLTNASWAMTDACEIRKIYVNQSNLFY